MSPVSRQASVQPVPPTAGYAHISKQIFRLQDCSVFDLDFNHGYNILCTFYTLPTSECKQIIICGDLFPSS